MPAQPMPATGPPSYLAGGPTGPGRAPDLRTDPGPVGALVRAVAALAAQHPAELPGPVALAPTAVVLQQLEVLRVIALGRLADVDTRQLHHLHGAPSTASWVDRQGVPGLDPGQVALARKLRALPATTEQITAGRLSLAAGQLISTALAKVRPHLDRPDGQLDGHPQQQVLRNVLVEGIAMLTAQALGGAPASDPDHDALRTLMGQLADAPLSAAHRLEAGFVHLAQHIEPALLRPALDRLVDALLPNQHAKRARDAHRRRGFGLTLNHDKTGWQLTHHQLDLTLGELLWTVMHAAMTTDPDNPLDTAAQHQLRQPPSQGGYNGHTPRTNSANTTASPTPCAKPWTTANSAAATKPPPTSPSPSPSTPCTTPPGRYPPGPTQVPTGQPSWSTAPCATTASPDSSSTWPAASNKSATANGPSNPTNASPYTPNGAANAPPPAAPAAPATASPPTTPPPGGKPKPPHYPTPSRSAPAPTTAYTKATKPSNSKTAAGSTTTAGPNHHEPQRRPEF